MKQTLYRITIAALAITGAALAMAQQPITVTVNGRPIQFNNGQPIQEQGRVLVPLRGVFEALGAYVHWTAATQTIDANRGNTTVELQIGNHDAHVNGKDVNLDVPPQLSNDTTMVPLRFVSEALGADVNWMDAQQTVAIKIGPAGPGHDEHYGGDHHDVGHHAPPPPPPPPALHNMILNTDLVVPTTLDQPLASDRNQVGDTFTVEVNQMQPYAGMPAATKIGGHVTGIRPRDGVHPGIITVAFDEIVFPDGHTMPIRGKLIGLGGDSVSRGGDGRFRARPEVAHTPTAVAFIGFGSNGFSFGLYANGQVATDPHVHGKVGQVAVQVHQHPELARNIYLQRGTAMGVRITQEIILR
jgi:Copper amine oxidase N-terminal domain